jgi:hypothetical protein
MKEELGNIPYSPTFGEQLVGLTFNPSNDAQVQRAKELCAELADLVENDYQYHIDKNIYQKRILHDAAIADILKAQMIAVKLLTFKF